MITLRDYQNHARYQVNTLVNAKRHPVLVMPTGAGKTKTAVVITEDQIKLGKRIWVLTPQTEIFDQWLKDFNIYGLEPGYINQEGIKGKNRNVYVCMPLTLVNILHLIPESIYPDVIITDECHHSAASSWETIYNFFQNSVKMGLTATPQRTDKKGLDHIYTDIVQTISIKELIKNNFLAVPMVIVPEEYHLTVPIKNGDYDPEEQARLLGDMKIIGNVIENYEKIFLGSPVLVACSTFDHAKIMTEKFKEAGWQWNHIHSLLPDKDRKRMLRQIKNKELNGLCTVGIGLEGLDIPGLYGLIWLRRTLSLTIYLQFIGRVLRISPGKKYGIILDPVGNTFIHGFPDDHRNWTLKGKSEKDTDNDDIPKMRLCPCCKVMNSLENDICYFCGADLNEKNIKLRKMPVMIDGELVIINSNSESEELKNYTDNLKLKQEEAVIEKKKQEEELLSISDNSKMSIIKDDLFKNKRKFFVETLRGFM